MKNDFIIIGIIDIEENSIRLFEYVTFLQVRLPTLRKR
jgi:hypothetical protein